MSAYREGFGPVERRRAEVALVRERVEAAAAALTALRAQRIGRIAGGVVGLTILALTGPVVWLTRQGALVDSPFLAAAFFGSGLAAVGVALVVSAAIRVFDAGPRPGTAAHARRRAADAAALLRAADAREVDALDPWPRLRVALAALEGPSLVLPLVLAAMVLPLTAHGLLFLLPVTLLAGLDDAVRTFSTWIAISAVLVGHAHVAVAVCAGRWAQKMGRMSFEELAAADVRKEWTRALWVAVGVASVPGILFVAVPTVLALVTGLAVLPLVWHAARRVLLRERLVLETLDEEVSAVNVGFEEMEEARRGLTLAAEPAERVRVAALASPAEPAEEEEREEDAAPPERRVMR